MENKDKERLQKLFDEFLDQDLFQISLGNPLDRETIQKAKVRPFLSGGELRFQLEEWIGKQVFHKNMDREECGAWLTKLLGQSFRQCEIQSEKGWAQVLVGRRGTVTIKKKGNPAGEPARIKPAVPRADGSFSITEKRHTCWKRESRFRFWWIWG